MKHLKKYFVLGLATILPLFVTVYLIVFIFNFADRIAGTYINALLMKKCGFSIPGLGLITLLLLFLGTGFFSSHFIGKKLFRVFELLFQRIPVAARIYPSIKQLSDFLFRGDELRRLKKVVLVEYPYPGSSSIGFLTNENPVPFNQGEKAETVSVLVPLAPSPFSGFILLLSPDKVTPVDMSIEDAIKFIVSGGIVCGEENQKPKKTS